MTTYQSRGIEYRIVVPGRAVSFRSPNASTYKDRVRCLGLVVFRRPLDGDRLVFLIDYFHRHRRRFDMDNVAKAVMDALTGVAYGDDIQVGSVTARAHFVGDILKIQRGPADLIKPLADYSEYLFVRVRQM